ncbi:MULTISPECIES: MBL fold metallo-hydrolase [Streptomyces]|uniref:MBL fold metallo-hydrolase n=1 Tax=Streptomyces TaxID=1883 RepID=UPI0004CCF5FC|nr:MULTISPECIES: MBL fold metallo-hydrolase [Streptomyces]OXZ01556.1 MBL fold metallo-hydrolase [Streptomyces sp. 2R]QQZ52898.1 MBL fold metallo-hydrolase [Streptomyces microflavus]QTA30597.1 cyclase [Streptomyces sp. CA-256286]WSR89988.1 MBL fold metallo-hydrolase [Streptomyces microflavus]WTF67982.1 MBL fold metallo-hydrolase [Streptomyces microflavus]
MNHTLGHMQEVADGVLVYVQPDGGWCLSNAGVLVSGGEAAVIDTAATERRARALRAEIVSLTGAVPRTVVNTHFHGDHSFGNYVFTPDAVIVAHEAARAEMAVAGLGLQGLWPGVDWGNVALALPTLTFRDRMTLHVGELTAQLIHPGPAHTTTDTVVWVPDRSVLFVGDIVMNGATPFCLMGSVAGSLRTIEHLRSYGARTVVTGHGPVGGPEIFDAGEAYLRWLQQLAADGVRAGLSPLQMARMTDLGEFAGLLDSERLVGNLHRAYAEENGRAPGVALDVAEIFAEMVEFHGSLPACHA